MLRALLLGLIGLGLVGFGAIVWLALPAKEAAVAAPAPRVKAAVLVAGRAIKPGSLMKPEDVMTREVEVDALPPGHVVDTGDLARTLIGGLVRRNIVAGDVLRLPADVLRPGDHGFLAAVRTPGTRAVSIGVDAVSGAAGLIWPGDRVDIILTQAATEAAQPGRRVSAETVLRDVRVIAIDQQLVQGAEARTDQKPARTITIEVTPPQSEVVQVGARLGQLSFVVRSAEIGTEKDSGPGITYSGDVSGAWPTPDAKPTTTSIKVYQGSADGKEFKF